MGNETSTHVEGVSEAELAEVQQKTSFSREDLASYYDMFMRKYENGHMTIDEFVLENMALQGGSEEFWTGIGKQFADGDDKITFAEFVVGLSSMTDGTLEEKLEWTFKLYDADGNGVLDKEEVRHLVKGVVKGNQSNETHRTDEDLNAEADRMFAQMDDDNNGGVDLQEFINVAKNTPSIREALTPALEAAIRVDGGRGQFSTFDNQVAGHSDGDAAMLKDPTGKMIFKPMALLEYEFYEDVQQHQDARDLFPMFKGRKVVESSDGTGTAKYIVLEDLTSGLKKPCIMDLKVGFKGHDSQAKGKKVVQQVFLCSITTSSSLGFRLCGMKYHQENGDVVGHGKPWGAKLSKTTMPLAMLEFVSTRGNGMRHEVVLSILEQLYNIKAWFDKQTLYKMYSSSILFIYDAAAPADAPRVNVKLVDFAHTEKVTDGTLDLNYLNALNIMISIWEDISQCGVEVWENQRRKGPTGKYTKASLTKLDRAAFSSKDGAIPLALNDPNSWVVDKERGDDEGWSYGVSWKGPWATKPSLRASVRRRRWIKKV